MIAVTTAHCQEHFPAASLAILYVHKQSPLRVISGAILMDCLCTRGGPATTDLDGQSSYRPLALALEPSGAEVLRLSKAQRGMLTELISVVKQTGAADDVTVGAFVALLKQLEAAGVEAAVLACTELPLVSERLGPRDVHVELIDPTELLAAALLAR